MEIITGVERRRQWRDEEKLRILAELNEPGVKFSEVARRHDISRGLLWQWRDAQRHGRVGGGKPGFLPFQGVEGWGRRRRASCRGRSCRRWLHWRRQADRVRRPMLALPIRRTGRTSASRSC